MWASLSLLLVVLMLALSLRFYLSHCLPHSGRSGKASYSVSNVQKKESTTLKSTSTNMRQASRSLKRDLTSLRTTSGNLDEHDATITIGGHHG